MYSDWSAELSGDSPVLHIPWQDDSGQILYIDLRAQPERILELPEASQHPALRSALLALNRPASSLETAKCDVWPLDASDVAACADLLDLTGEENEPRFGFGSYIDTVLRDHEAFASFDLHNELLRNLARGAATLDLDQASAEFVLRLCAREEAGETRVGHAVTVYVYGVGGTEEEAYRNWSEALGAITEILLEL